MPKYVSVKVRPEVLDYIREAQLPGEPLSDTLWALLDPHKHHGRKLQRKAEEKETR